MAVVLFEFELKIKLKKDVDNGFWLCIIVGLSRAATTLCTEGLGLHAL